MIPLDTIDKLSDRKEFYDTNMDDEIPTDAPRPLEIHHAERKEEPNNLDHAGPSKIPSSNFIQAPPLKKEKLFLKKC